MYRLGCELSVWSDSGVGSLRRYYEALRLEELDERWGMTTDPKDLENPNLWDWGYDQETNTRIHASRLRALPAKEERPVPEPVGEAGPEDIFALPALIEFDLLRPDLGAPVRVRRVPFDMYPGLGREERRKRPEITEFGVKIPLADEHDGRSCLVLLLTMGLVERLAGLKDLKSGPAPGASVGLPRRDVHTQEEVIEVVTDALSPDKLEPADDASEADLWLASRRSLVLSCAPGLAGTVAEGMFTFKPFALSDNPSRKFPQMPGATWLVLCLGERNP
jgi:hypothetical protein